MFGTRRRSWRSSGILHICGFILASQAVVYIAQHVDFSFDSLGRRAFYYSAHNDFDELSPVGILLPWL